MWSLKEIDELVYVKCFSNGILFQKNYLHRFPLPTEGLVDELKELEVDIMNTREEAGHFLAIRHIERTREWSPIAKMRFCFEDYKDGRTINEIFERTGIRKSDIQKFIRQYKVLTRGINALWKDKSERSSQLLQIKPNMLLRLFTLADTQEVLKLRYDEDWTLKSDLLSDVELDEVIAIWAQKAFIEHQINTRTLFGEYKRDGKSTNACQYIGGILDKYYSKQSMKDEKESLNRQSKEKESNSNPTTSNQTASRTTSSLPKNPPFLGALDYRNVDPLQANGKGVIAVCEEALRISNDANFVDRYPICTAIMLRSLIEQSIIYHAKINNEWSVIMKTYNQQNNRIPNIGFIIDHYERNISRLIPDPQIKRVFNEVFVHQNKMDKFNLVVHSPELYRHGPEILKTMPDEGLLAIVNYFLQ